jgi:hypothetical protein
MEATCVFSYINHLLCTNSKNDLDSWIVAVARLVHLDGGRLSVSRQQRSAWVRGRRFRDTGFPSTLTPHCVLKWGFTLTLFATLEKMFEFTFTIDRRCLKLSLLLWFTHWWNCLCETDWLGVAKDIEEILKLKKKRSDFNFTVTSWFLGNVRVIPYLNRQCPILEICSWT